jgi:hypothetical protein
VTREEAGWLHCDGISRAQMGSVEERFTRPSTMEGLSRSLRRAGPVLWVVWVDLFSSPHQRISPGRHSDYLSLPRLSESKPCRCIPTGKPRCSGQAGAGLTADGTGPALIFPWEICEEILTPPEAWFPPYPRQQARPPSLVLRLADHTGRTRAASGGPGTAQVPPGDGLKPARPPPWG